MTWANDYVGVPYVDLGRTKSGADCYGLIRLVQAEVFDVSMPLLTIHSAPRTRDLAKEFVALRKQWKKVETPEEGDVLIFKTRAQANHVAVAIGHESFFLHTEPMKNSCIESWESPLWRHLLDSVWRHHSKCPHM